MSNTYSFTGTCIIILSFPFVSANILSRIKSNFSETMLFSIFKPKKPPLLKNYIEQRGFQFLYTSSSFAGCSFSASWYRNFSMVCAYSDFPVRFSSISRTSIPEDSFKVSCKVDIKLVA